MSLSLGCLTYIMSSGCIHILVFMVWKNVTFYGTLLPALIQFPDLLWRAVTLSQPESSCSRWCPGASLTPHEGASVAPQLLRWLWRCHWKANQNGGLQGSGVRFSEARAAGIAVFCVDSTQSGWLTLVVSRQCSPQTCVKSLFYNLVIKIIFSMDNR